MIIIEVLGYLALLYMNYVALLIVWNIIKVLIWGVYSFFREILHENKIY